MFAEILLTQKIGKDRQTLTYAIPENISADIKLGMLVEAPLRNKKIKGIVYKLEKNPPPYPTKEISKIIENAPHLETWQIDLLHWLAEYYFCPLYKALKLFLPVPFIVKKEIAPAVPSEMFAYQFDAEHQLNQTQIGILKNLKKSEKAVSLLHGITASGKTEIYLHLADQQLRQNRQVLILIPEISLTPQTVQRFKSHFKQNIAVIHSQLTSKEKEKAWLDIHKGNAKIIIGSRSALFAPFQKLGYIIIDEEHDSCYKQDQAPRYHATDVAIQMAKILNIKVLLGSATPSLESYYQAKLGNFDLQEMSERANKEKGVKLPETTIIDMRIELKKKNFTIFSELLGEKLKEKLNRHEQIILFLNRRGSASAVICRSCGYIAKCSHCETTMTYHKKLNIEGGIFNAQRLICHHCGHIDKVPLICPVCKSAYIRYIGLGTERVEEDLQNYFPLARILRADRDTVKKKNSFELIYQTFKNHEADVLIGTQMIAMGLHLPKVNLVGVVLADLGLTIPNFRSSEKTFQLITQVGGRAGRSENGEVIIQTYLPQHYAITKAAKHDYIGFYDQEITIRQKLHYPPFTKLIKLTLSSGKMEQCAEKTEKLFVTLQKIDDDNGKSNIITYYPALIPRLRNKYRWHILITGENPAKLLKKAIKQSSDLFEKVSIDVDPLSTI